MNKDAPKGWNLVNFDSFFTVLPSKKYQVQKQEYLEKGLVPVVDQGQKLIIGYTDDESKKFNKNKVIVFGDHTRIVKYVDFEFAVGADGTQILETKDGIDLKFGYYQLLNKKIPDTGYNRHFKYVKAEKYVIPPTLAEQQEIVHVLDTMSDIIRLREECISHAQDLIFAIFREMFGDVLKRVENVRVADYFDVGTGGTPSREKLDKFYNNGDIPWVKTTEVNNCYINKTEEKITELALKQTNCTLYPKNTILMAMYGQGKTRGKVAYLNISATTNQACAALQLKPQINNVNTKYVFYYLQYIYDYLRTLSQGGGRPNMNLSIVRKIPLYLPSINLQNAYSGKVTELELYIKEQQEELENAKQMFQSLLHHAFTGKLTAKKYGDN